MSEYDEIVWVTDPSTIIPNYDDLSEEDKIRATEMIYRRQLMWMHGWKPGEHMLLSGGKIKEEYGD